MHIQKLTSVSPKPNINTKKSQQHTNNITPNGSFSVCCGVLSSNFYNINFKQKLNYNDFLCSVHKFHKNKSIKNIILSTISDKNNYIGSGFSADVYSIPNVENYLIRIERKNFSAQSLHESPIISEPQNEFAPNFGQYIATNNQGLFITKKVSGESHSLPNWSEVIRNIENGTSELTKDQVKLIFEKIINLSQFPQKSFDELAKNIQKLNRYTDCEIDIMNPNNLIVDNKTKSISIIDLWYHHSDNGSVEPFNGIDSMINLILDPFTYCEVLKKLDKENKNQFLKSSEVIIQKIFSASQKAGLERTKDNAKIIYRDFDKHSNLNFALPAYEKFLEIHNKLL